MRHRTAQINETKGERHRGKAIDEKARKTHQERQDHPRTHLVNNILSKQRKLVARINEDAHVAGVYSRGKYYVIDDGKIQHNRRGGNAHLIDYKKHKQRWQENDRIAAWRIWHRPCRTSPSGHGDPSNRMLRKWVGMLLGPAVTQVTQRQTEFTEITSLGYYTMTTAPNLQFFSKKVPKAERAATSMPWVEK